jgi:hypothetical protein
MLSPEAKPNPKISFNRRNKVTYASIILIAFLIISNPSIESFRNYAIDLHDYKVLSLKKESYFIIFSIYSKEFFPSSPAKADAEKFAIKRRYLGIAGNFFQLDDRVDLEEALSP